MGKQINYYMEYDSFVLLAKKAVELGCEILPFSAETLKRGCSLDIVSKEELNYCFHVPEAGEISIRFGGAAGGVHHLDRPDLVAVFFQQAGEPVLQFAILQRGEFVEDLCEDR